MTAHTRRWDSDVSGPAHRDRPDDATLPRCHAKQPAGIITRGARGRFCDVCRAMEVLENSPIMRYRVAERIAAGRTVLADLTVKHPDGTSAAGVVAQLDRLLRDAEVLLNHVAKTARDLSLKIEPEV